MIGIRRLTACLVFVVALSLTVGASGLGSTSAERSVHGVVAEDSDAYLGVETLDHELEAGQSTNVTLVRLENRIGKDLTDIDVSIVDGEATSLVLEGYETPPFLGPWDRGSVTATVTCDAEVDTAATEAWLVSVAVAGDGVGIELDRTVRVSCVNDTTASTSDGSG